MSVFLDRPPPCGCVVACPARPPPFLPASWPDLSLPLFLSPSFLLLGCPEFLSSCLPFFFCDLPPGMCRLFFGLRALTSLSTAALSFVSPSLSPLFFSPALPHRQAHSQYDSPLSQVETGRDRSASVPPSAGFAFPLFSDRYFPTLLLFSHLPSTFSSFRDDWNPFLTVLFTMTCCSVSFRDSSSIWMRSASSLAPDDSSFTCFS